MRRPRLDGRGKDLIILVQDQISRGSGRISLSRWSKLDKSYDNANKP